MVSCHILLFFYWKNILFPFLSFVLFRLSWLPQNTVYVLLDNVVFLALFFQFSIISVKGFFLYSSCIAARLGSLVMPDAFSAFAAAS